MEFVFFVYHKPMAGAARIWADPPEMTKSKPQCAVLEIGFKPVVRNRQISLS